VRTGSGCQFTVGMEHKSRSENYRSLDNCCCGHASVAMTTNCVIFSIV
jgi:hypothetical protein